MVAWYAGLGVVGKTMESALLAAMADGIGDLAFASPEWVAATQEALIESVQNRAGGLEDLAPFTLCEVAHNPPAYLHCGSSLAWHARFDGASVSVAAGELPTQECDFKVEGDHSIISNLARIQYHNRDPKLVAAAQARLTRLSRWKTHGGLPEHAVLGAVLRELHDAQAVRTMPRFVFMTPEWVRYDKEAKGAPVEQSSPSGKGQMPDALSRIFMPLHDELGKRTSGELPSDFDSLIKPSWSQPQGFDRDAGYDASWACYDEVDIFGNQLD